MCQLRNCPILPTRSHLPTLRRGTEAYPHTGASPVSAGADAEHRAMRPRDLIDYGQPQAATDAGGAGKAVEALPYPAALSLRDARTVVLDLQIGGRPIHRAAHGHVAAAGGVLQGIVDQILQQILEQSGISCHTGRSGVRTQIDSDLIRTIDMALDQL